MGNKLSESGCCIAMSLCGKESDEVSEGVRISASHYIDERRGEYGFPTMELRECFVQVPEIHSVVNPNHTHGKAAAERSKGSAMIEIIGTTAARPVVYYQGSAADERKGKNFSRSYYWVKDLNVSAAKYDPPENAIIGMVDVDYYVDMNQFLLDNFRPVVLYTFQPETLGTTEGDFAFCFDQSGEVRYDVAGGSGYSHRVWHYTGDSLIVRGEWCGITVKAHTYAVEKRGVGTHHQLVLLSPIAKYTGLAAWIVSKLIGGQSLGRLDPRVGNGFLRMQVHRKDGLWVVTGRVDNHACAVVRKDIDDEIASMARTSKSFTLSMVKGKVGDDLRGVNLLLEYHAWKQPCNAPKMSIVDSHVRTYQFVSQMSELDTDATASMVSFMRPLVDGAFCPAICRNNDDRAVAKRVIELQKNPPPASEFLFRCMQEFADCLSMELGRGRLFPVDIGEVYERQSKPGQQRILEAAEYEERSGKTSTFMKREAYQNPNDPRIISQINGVDKREWSQFMYAFGDFMKTLDWYASGVSNETIALRVADVCSGASYAILTDFSRMDGRVNETVRLLEKTVLLKVFHESCHAELLRVAKTQYQLRGKTKNGVSYDTGFSRCSGSPETAVFNAMLNKFVCFLAHRMMQKEVARAYRAPGVYCGDDGVTADTPKDRYERAASAMGQVLTAELVPCGKLGIKFLSRHYGPDVWEGDATSMTSPARALSKFHVTVHMPKSITPDKKLLDKAYALWLNDSNTPVLGDFVDKVVRMYGVEKSAKRFQNLNRIWSANSETRYPNERADWMYDVFVNELPEFDQTRFHEWLSDCSSLHQLMSPPAFMEAVTPVPKPGITEIDGNFLVIEEPRPEDPMPEEPFTEVKKKKRLRKPRPAGEPKQTGKAQKFTLPADKSAKADGAARRRPKSSLPKT